MFPDNRLQPMLFSRRESVARVRRQIIRFGVLMLLCSFLQAPPSAYAAAPEEALVSSFLVRRQSLATDEKVDTAELSKAIRAAITSGERLEREAKYEAALAQLTALDRFMPILDIPSFDVQMLASWLYMKLGNASLASAHRARADAMREVLQNRIGSGKSVDSPIQAVMISDIAEWARMQLAQISDVRSLPYKGHELMAVRYSGPSTNNEPVLAYFELYPRVQARTNAHTSLFAPLPLEQMNPEQLALIEKAKAKREAFLNDTSFPYLALMDKVKTALQNSGQLMAQGKSQEAVVALREIEVIRPIEDIPLPQLIARYSALQGKIGNNDKQNELRGLLFGITQVIAHSGDGMSAETAVPVISTLEEYAWLSDKHLGRTSQKVINTPLGKFDVLTAKNTAGQERDYYFNITRMFPKYGQGLLH